jgi:hypothetical protein
MDGEVVQGVVAILDAHRIRLFHDPGTEPIWITETLSAADVLRIIGDPSG